MINIPGYKLERELGIGGMATVFLAVQENLHRQVALKVMTPGLSVDETYCHRFLKEGRIAAQLSHANLLTVYDIGVHENHYYMASEYLSGGTVRSKMSRLTVDEIVRIVRDIASGLSYAHKKGFVHRDVKPGNLLFRANGDCVLADFGIAKAVDSNTGATKLGTSIGTPHYMSPEQAKGEKVDHRTDLYSLGVVFFEMLAKHPPFEAEDPFSVALAQINEPVPKLAKPYEQFQGVIEKLMTKDQNFRYATADEFLRDLNDLTDRRSKPGVPKPKAKPTPVVNKRAKQKTLKPENKAKRQRSSEGSSLPIKPIAIGVIAVAVLASSVIGYQQFIASDNSNGQSGQTDPVVNTQDGNTDPQPTPAPSRDPVAEEIENRLARADEFIATGRYFTPMGDNAYEMYQKALDADPSNERVQMKVRELANVVERAAEDAISANRTNEARRLLQSGIRYYPDDQGLRSLLGLLDTNNATVNTDPDPQPVVNNDPEPTPPVEQPVVNDEPPPAVATSSPEVLALLEQGDRYFEAEQLISPRGKNATETYLKVLEIEPDNQRAQQRLIEIADNWVLAAEQLYEEGEVNIARRMVDRALQATPDYPKLLELKRKIDGG